MIEATADISQTQTNHAFASVCQAAHWPMLLVGWFRCLFGGEGIWRCTGSIRLFAGGSIISTTGLIRVGSCFVAYCRSCAVITLGRIAVIICGFEGVAFIVKNIQASLRIRIIFFLAFLILWFFIIISLLTNLSRLLD